MKREAMNNAWEQFGFGEFGCWGLKEKKKIKKKVLGLVSLDIEGWKKIIIIINNKVKAALTQSMEPTKSKLFWVVKIENKYQTCHLKKF